MGKLNYICKKIFEAKPDATNLLVQKLLYFIQAYSLANDKGPAFDQEIEAWMYGPVIPEVYRELKYNRESYLYVEGENILTSDIEEKVDEVIDNLKDVDPYILVDITHSYDTWKKNWEKNSLKKVISNAEIEDFHKQLKNTTGRVF